MNEKKTTDLEKILESTHIRNFSKYCENNKESLMHYEKSYTDYFKDLIREKGLSLQEVFLHADIPERYGYKLLSGEKRTRQRDVILRICYSAKFTLEETQRALKKYGLPQLYAKIPRDAFLMILFNERPGNILQINILLAENGLQTLRTSGVQN